MSCSQSSCKLFCKWVDTTYANKAMSQCGFQILKTGPCLTQLWGHCSQVYYEKNKKKLEDKEKCEESNRKCNMENVLMGHINHRNKIKIWNVKRKYLTTTDKTKRHMENLYHCSLCGKESIHRSHMKSHATQIWILMHCVEGKFYPGTIQKDTVKWLLRRIYITVLCLAK